MAELPTEKVMEQRRLERLKSLEFFMRDERVPPNGRRIFSLSATHTLLTGFFQNSYWRTAWYCVQEAVRDSWMKFCICCQWFWWLKVLRLNQQQIDERIERDSSGTGLACWRIVQGKNYVE